MLNDLIAWLGDHDDATPAELLAQLNPSIRDAAMAALSDMLALRLITLDDNAKILLTHDALNLTGL